jgi:hypothetical protein
MAGVAENLKGRQKTESTSKPGNGCSMAVPKLVARKWIIEIITSLIIR